MLNKKTITGNETQAELVRIKPNNTASQLFIIKKLLNDNNILEALEYFSPNCKKEIADIFYGKAVELFYKNCFDSAETIYNKLISLNKEQHFYLINKCYFDLAIVLINKKEFRKAFNTVCNVEALNNSNLNSIISLMGSFFRIKFIEENSKSLQELVPSKILRSSIKELVNNIIKTNSTDLFKMSDSKLNDLKLILKKNGYNIDNSHNTTLKKLIFFTEELTFSLKSFFLINVDAQEEYLLSFPTNIIDYDTSKFENVYLNYIKQIVQNKLSEIRTYKEIITADYSNSHKISDPMGFSGKKEISNTQNKSDDHILYAIFKFNIQNPNSLLATAVFQLIKNKNIFEINALTSAIKRLALQFNKISILEDILSILLKHNPNDLSVVVQLGIIKFLNNNYKDNPLCEEATHLFKKIINHKETASGLELTLSMLGLQHIMYLINYEKVTKIADSHKLNAELAVKLLLSEYKLGYDSNKNIRENLFELEKVLNIFYSNDLRIKFIEFIISVTHPN